MRLTLAIVFACLALSPAVFLAVRGLRQPPPPVEPTSETPDEISERFGLAPGRYVRSRRNLRIAIGLCTVAAALGALIVLLIR